MAKSCFDNVPHESLDACPNDEVSGGISTRILYAPKAFVGGLSFANCSLKLR